MSSKALKAEILIFVLLLFGIPFLQSIEFYLGSYTRLEDLIWVHILVGFFHLKVFRIGFPIMVLDIDHVLSHFEDLLPIHNVYVTPIFGFVFLKTLRSL